MAAVMNGIALHGGFIPYGGTFLTFSDYSRNAIRMAALMKQRVIHVFTHDSIGLGEDGPTHQSVEHAAVAAADPGPRRLASGRHRRDRGRLGARRSSNRSARRALLLSRQNLPYAPKAALDDIARGAYVLAEPAEVGLKKKPQAVIVATGSEVQLALHAQAAAGRRRHRGARGVDAVAPPSSTARTAAYKTQVLPDGVPRIAVEAGVTDGWWKYGCAAVVGIDRYGEIGARRRAVQALRLHGGERGRHRAFGAAAMTASGRRIRFH